MDVVALCVRTRAAEEEEEEGGRGVSGGPTSTVSTIWTWVTSCTGWTTTVVCMIMTTGCANTIRDQKGTRNTASAQSVSFAFLFFSHACGFYTRSRPAIPVTSGVAGVASAVLFSFLCLRVPRPMEPTPAEGSWSGTLAKVCV